MVRRWSYLNSFNVEFYNILNINKYFKISNFKSSVSFKRFTANYTKFKRKSLVRVRHKNNWLIYTNIIKFWVQDYTFFKNYFKFQYFNKILPNGFIFYNFNFLKNKQSLNNNFVFNLFLRRYSLYFKINFFNFYKNSSLNLGWYSNTLTHDTTVIPLNEFYGNNFFPVTPNSNLGFDFKKINNFVINVFIIKIFEIYKILTILFYINLKN